MTTTRSFATSSIAQGLPFARVCAIALAASIAACGSDGGTDPPPGGDTALQFEVFSGGQACAGSCGGDSGDGAGVGSGGDGGDGAGGGLSAMRNVNVRAYKPDGTLLGSAALQNNLVSLYPRAYKGPFILSFADDGSGNGQYFDESKRAWTALQGQSLHVLVPALTHHVSANPLTEAAYQLALARAGSEAALNAQNMAAANEDTRKAFNARLAAEYQISDITNYAEPVFDTTAAGTLANTHAGRFGTVLAGMPIAATSFDSTLTAPALAFTRQLVADVVDDGGFNNSAAVAVRAYGSNLPAVLAQGVDSAKQSFASPAQPSPSPVFNNCFNPALYTIGTVGDLTYLQSGAATGSQRTVVEVTRNTTFNGSNALEVVYTSSDGVVKEYSSAPSSSGQTFFGQVATSGGFTTTFANQPAYVDRSSLFSAGQSDAVNYTMVVTTTDASGIVVGSPITYTVNESTTLVGFEDVTVPAGTFKNACRYARTRTSTFTISGITTTTVNNTVEWVTSSGQGLPVKLIDSDGSSAGTTQELQSGTLNSVAVK